MQISPQKFSPKKKIPKHKKNYANSKPKPDRTIHGGDQVKRVRDFITQNRIAYPPLIFYSSLAFAVLPVDLLCCLPCLAVVVMLL